MLPDGWTRGGSEGAGRRPDAGGVARDLEVAGVDRPSRGGELLRAVLERATDVMAVLDADGAIRFVSPSVERMLGYRPEEMLGTDALGYVHPRDLQEARIALAETPERTGRGRELPPLVFRVRASDGSWRSVEVARSGSSLGETGPGGVVVSLRDITERVRAEEALRREHEGLLGSVDAIIWRGDPETFRFTFVSEQAEAILGYPPERWTGEPSFWAEHIHPEDREWALSYCKRATAEKRSHAFEYRMVAADGRVVWLRDVVHVAVEDGAPAELFGVMVDVTDRKKAEEELRRSEERFRSLVEHASDVVFVLGDDGTIRYASPSVERVLGYHPEEMVGTTAFEYDHPDDAGRIAEDFARCREKPGVWPPVQLRMRHRDGSWRHVEVVRNNRLDDPSLGGVVVNARDITEYRETSDALRESEQRFKRVFEDSAIGMALLTPDGRYLRANRAFREMLGYTDAELSGMTFREITHPDDLEENLRLGRRLIAGEIRTLSMEKRYARKDGSWMWAELTVSLLRGASGEPLYSIAQIQDITERRRAEERLRYRAFHDLLTGLPNRHLFMERLEQALGEAGRRPGRGVAVLLMDLDDFKVVNDSLGHETGDRLLASVARRLVADLGPEETLARFGGDEFTVLVEGVEAARDAARVAARITEQLREPFRVGGRELFVRGSIGIALGDARKSPEDLLRDADTAMYRAKGSGGGHRVFDAAMYEQTMARLELENDLRHAAGRGEFVVHYQPIVDLRTGGLWGLEALVRWNHPERGLLDPDEFVPVAERSGLVIPLGARVLEEVCRRAAGWRKEPTGEQQPVVFVNLSGRQLRSPQLYRIVERALAESGLSPFALGLDVTETVLVGALDGEIAPLERIKALGVRVSIDDFGTGYSSLSAIKHLPADVLKMDRSFVRGLGRVAEDTAIARAIVDLAHIVGLEVAAEGVETGEQAALLREMGCDHAQGFYFSKPLPAEEVPALLTG